MIFVTVGTHEQPFNRLIKKIDELKGSGSFSDDVIIQTGFSEYRPINCHGEKFFSHEEMLVVLFIFCTLLASVFHLTALLVAPMYFFSTCIPVTKRSLVLCCMFGGALLVIVYPIIRILVKVRLFSKYEQYLDSAATVGYRFIIASVIMGVFYFVIVLVYLRSIESLSEDARQYIRMIMIGLILTIVSVRFFYLSRVAYYFLQFLPLLVANAFNKQMNDTTIARTMRSWILIWLTIYCFLFTAFSGENNYYNYSTIFNDVPVSVQEFISR